MNKLAFFWLIISVLSISSCSCDPEKIVYFAFRGMESMMGEGFMPSEEIRSLGQFQSMSVSLSKSTRDEGTEATIFLKLQNGDPLYLGKQPEILARKCAEIYIRDFENSSEYQKITIQFIQNDPGNPENFAMQEYTFQIADFI